MKVEIDENSGFCFGVTTAIRRAEEKLAEGGKLYCLGDIVHNGMEVNRLAAQGLRTIGHEELQTLYGATVLLRAHGEPPETYATARNHNIEIIDATCPVVLALQRRIYAQCRKCPDAQIVIFGKKGHAEVLGLVGQTNQNAIVVESLADLARLDFSRDIYLYSQTTKSIAQYQQIIDFCRQNISPQATFKSFDTICRQVANRINEVKDFASGHDLIIFVCGRKSSNGKALFDQCLSVNPNTRLVENPNEIRRRWLDGAETIGVCGATSTPKWLMEACKNRIESFSNDPQTVPE